MVRWVVGSILHGEHMTGVTKTVVCIILWDGAYKRTLSVNQRVTHVAAVGFLSRYLSGPLPYF